MKRGSSGKKHGRKAGFKFSHAIKHSKLFNNPDGTSRGFLATFETKLITVGITEALAVLNYYADRLYGASEETEDGEKKRFCVYDAGVAGLAAIRAVDDVVQPVALAKYIAECLSTGPIDDGAIMVARAKSLQRLQPVELFCAASAETLRLAVQPLLSKTFPPAPGAAAEEGAAAATTTNAKGMTFAVAINTRGSSRLTREEAIETVTGLVATPPNSVDLKAPQMTVSLDVFKSACGVACISEYGKFRKFNLRLLLGDRVPKELLKKPKKIRKIATDQSSAPSSSSSSDQPTAVSDTKESSHPTAESVDK